VGNLFWHQRLPAGSLHTVMGACISKSVGAVCHPGRRTAIRSFWPQESLHYWRAGLRGVCLPIPLFHYSGELDRDFCGRHYDVRSHVFGGKRRLAILLFGNVSGTGACHRLGPWHTDRFRSLGRFCTGYCYPIIRSATNRLVAASPICHRSLCTVAGAATTDKETHSATLAVIDHMHTTPHERAALEGNK